MNRHPYPAYKPSGVEWLGKIPVRWDIWKATHAFRRIGSGTTPKSDNYEYYDGQIPWVTTSELRETDIDETLNKLTEEALRDYPALRLYPAGTLLFAMYGATVGRLGILKISAAVNQACAAFSEPIKLEPKFTYYWLYMRRPILIAISAGGGQPNLSQDDLKQLRIPAPPLQEQRTIAAYLDRETVRLDALIEKKQRQIELLQEKRAALISRAVTKGLDPNAKMKDSGVEWLGEIPERWNVLRLATICNKITNGYVGPTRDILVSDGVRYLQSLHIKRNQIQFDGRYFVENSWSRSHAKSILAEGDVLVVQTGDIGQVAVVPKEFEGSNCHALIILSCRPNHALGKFISLVLNSNYGFHSLNRIQTGALHPHLNCTFVREIHVPLPPPSEQHAIAAFLDRETTRIDTLVKKVKKSVTLLREYRASLISAAVTGKIDVRKEPT